MVAHDERGAGPRRRGKLSSDGSIDDAAVALILGFDPIQFLSYGPDDARIVAAVLRRAWERRIKRDQEIADYAAAKTAGLTVESLTRWLNKALEQHASAIVRGMTPPA